MMREQKHTCFTVSSTAYLRNLHPDDTRSAVAVHYQPPPKETENGRSIGLRFPLLIVASYVEEPERVAEKAAAILNDHWEREPGTGATLVDAVPGLLEALDYYADQFCEGWCEGSPDCAHFDDCGGCLARRTAWKARGEAA